MIDLIELLILIIFTLIVYFPLNTYLFWLIIVISLACLIPDVFDIPSVRFIDFLGLHKILIIYLLIRIFAFIFIIILSKYLKDHFDLIFIVYKLAIFSYLFYSNLYYFYFGPIYHLIS